jgi:hypothetical protein
LNSSRSSSRKILLTYPPGVSWSGEIIETPAESLTLASAFAIHGKGTRKRTYVFSDPVSRIFVVDDEYVIASTLAVILNMQGFSDFANDA